jgi:hypothetical protein
MDQKLIRDGGELNTPQIEVPGFILYGKMGTD